jgi:hypothetical protein
VVPPVSFIEQSRTTFCFGGVLHSVPWRSAQQRSRYVGIGCDRRARELSLEGRRRWFCRLFGPFRASERVHRFDNVKTTLKFICLSFRVLSMRRRHSINNLSPGAFTRTHCSPPWLSTHTYLRCINLRTYQEMSNLTVRPQLFIRCLPAGMAVQCKDLEVVQRRSADAEWGLLDAARMAPQHVLSTSPLRGSPSVVNQPPTSNPLTYSTSADTSLVELVVSHYLS